MVDLGLLPLELLGPLPLKASIDLSMKATHCQWAKQFLGEIPHPPEAGWGQILVLVRLWSILLMLHNRVVQQQEIPHLAEAG
jgi:hypothetical protein